MIPKSPYNQCPWWKLHISINLACWNLSFNDTKTANIPYMINVFI